MHQFQGQAIGWFTHNPLKLKSSNHIHMNTRCIMKIKTSSRALTFVLWGVTSQEPST